MPKLRNPTEAPPGDWVYHEVRSGLDIKANNIFELETKVSDHRMHRGWGPIDKQVIRAEIMRQICQRLSSAHCMPEGPDDPWKPVNDLTHGITLSQIMAASKAMLEWLSSGLGMAPIDEALKRREVCKTCPLNRPAHGCKCDVLYKMINAAVPDERRFADLEICGACGCSLKAKCSAPANVISASESGRDLTYPVGCWVPAVISQVK